MFYDIFMKVLDGFNVVYNIFPKLIEWHLFIIYAFSMGNLM